MLWSGFHSEFGNFSNVGKQVKERADVCAPRTLSLLLHAPRLGHGQTLHDLVLLPGLRVFRVHLVRRPLQHSAVEGVAVPPAGFLRPRHAVHCGHTEGKLAWRKDSTFPCDWCFKLLLFFWLLSISDMICNREKGFRLVAGLYNLVIVIFFYNMKYTSNTAWPDVRLQLTVSTW